MNKYTKQKQTKANKTKQNKKLKRSSTLRIKMANITEKFRVRTFQGAETWRLSTTLSTAQLALKEQNFFAITSSSEDVKDICFIKNELKAAFDVQHPDAKALAKATSENLMFKLNRTGLVLEDEGEPTSRMKLLEVESTQEYIDSDVDYGHVQNLLGVDTSVPFEWDSKRSVGLFATVRRVFFGTLPNDSQPEADYFGPPFMGDFGNPPENILNTNAISGQMSDLQYLRSKHIHAYHEWRMDFIQRVDHLLSFVLTDRLRTGYFNWHKMKFEEAEAARKQAEEEARIVKEKEARVAAEKKIQQIKSVAQQCRSWTRDDIQKFFSILSPEAMSTGETLLANTNGASSSSNKKPSPIEKRHANLDKVLKEQNDNRVAAEKARKEAEKAKKAEEAAQQTLTVLKPNESEAKNGGSANSDNAGTTTITNPKPVEQKEMPGEMMADLHTFYHGDGEKDKGLRGLVPNVDDAYYYMDGVKALEKSVWMEMHVKLYILTHPYDIFGNEADMIDQIEAENGKACRHALEGLCADREDLTKADYNTLKKKICDATGKTYVHVADSSDEEEEADDDDEGEGEEEEEEEEENEDENEDENEEEQQEEQEKEVVDLTVTIASKIDDLDVEDTLKEYLQTPGGEALCIFAYRSQLGEKNKDKILTVNSTSLKNKKITFDDIADLDLTEEFIQTYVIDFAKYVHEYCSNRKYDMGSLVMLTPTAFKTLDAAQRRRLPEKADTVWRVTSYNSDASYEIVAEFNTTEKVDAMEVDLMPPLNVAKKVARKRPRNDDGASSSTGGDNVTPSPKRPKRKTKQRQLPNVTRDDVNLNTSRITRLKTPTKAGFNA